VLPAHTDAASLGSLAAFGCSGLDQFSLEFREAAQNRQHQPTGGRRGIGPTLGQRDKQRFVVSDGFEDHQQINGGPCQSIQPGDHYDVTGLQRRYQLGSGQEFRFSVRLCPTIRITPSKDGSHAHGEQDAFLVAVQRGETNIEREAVYSRYFAERTPGGTVVQAKLTRFQLIKMTRPHRGGSAPASGVAQRVVPDAVLEGILTVTDPAAFEQTLMRGVGRQRAYGRGYVRLQSMPLGVAAGL
jgi:CRISPR associated protein